MKKLVLLILSVLILALGLFSQVTPQSRIRKEQIEDVFTRAARVENITAEWDFRTAFKMTNATPRGMLRLSASNVIETFAPMTNGQLIIGSTGAVPSLATLTGDDGVTITNGAGSITIDLGLPTSVNVLGNRAAAGEFVQRSSDTATLTNSRTLYVDSSAGKTFAVAFSATPRVMGAGTAATAAGSWVFAELITTTGFTLSVGGIGTSGAVTYFWVALGS